jgi:hypothetical protein
MSICNEYFKASLYDFFGAKSNLFGGFEPLAFPTSRGLFPSLSLVSSIVWFSSADFSAAIR